MQIEQIYTYGHDNSSFGGKLYNNDFEMYPVENIASRIASDMKFDEECKKNVILKNFIREQRCSW